MRLAPRKRAMSLVQMAHEASRFLPAGRRLRLTIVGDGPVTAQVRRYVDRNGLAYGRFVVDLAGRLRPDHVKATLAASDAFIAPAKLESFGIAALEARTMGLPVLAYAATGISSFVHHEVEGLLAADDRAMTDAIARIATDDALRERIAEHNRTHRARAVVAARPRHRRGRVRRGPRRRSAAPACRMISTRDRPAGATGHIASGCCRMISSRDHPAPRVRGRAGDATP